MHRRPLIAALALTAVSLSLTACGLESKAAATDNAGSNAGTKSIAVGFIPGPYSDMFKKAIQPQLEKQGYTVQVKEISDFTLPNQSTMAGDLNMNIFQNDGFMKLFNSEKGGDLVSLTKIPSAPLGLYRGKGTATTPAAIEDGSEIGLSSEASSEARSLKFLQTLGLIQLGDVPAGTMATPKDITSNPKHLTFKEIDAPQLVRSLSDLDYAVPLGNHVYASGTLSLADAIALETVPEVSQISVVVRGANKDSDWAKAVVNAYHSSQFKTFVESDKNFTHFTKPAWWK